MRKKLFNLIRYENTFFQRKTLKTLNNNKLENLKTNEIEKNDFSGILYIFKKRKNKLKSYFFILTNKTLTCKILILII